LFKKGKATNRKMAPGEDDPLVAIEGAGLSAILGQLAQVDSHQPKPLAAPITEPQQLWSAPKK